MRTDNPLKIALEFFSKEFCSWLLGKTVVDAVFRNSELIRDPKDYAVDALLEVTLADGKHRLLHIEFQGARSHRPMAVRMLNYFSLIAEQYGSLDIPLDSIVVYVGSDAGRHDTGQHTLGTPVIGTFNYKTLHLEDFQAAEILKTDNPLVISLIGQFKFSNAEQEVSQAFKKIVTLSPEDTREKLLHILIMLLPEKKLVERIEKMIAEQGLLMDTPYMQRILQERKAEFEAGVRQGLQEGEKKGWQEGLKEGVEKGRIEALHNMILTTLNVRFQLSAQELQTLAKKLEPFDAFALNNVATQAVIVKNIDDFKLFLTD